MIDSSLLAFATIGLVASVLRARYRLRYGTLPELPAFTAPFWLAIGLATVVYFELSPLHLLWWFPLSYPIGIAMLCFPLGLRITFVCMNILAWPGLKFIPPNSAK